MLSHPSELEIERFLASRLDPAGQQRVARHILAGCGSCSRKLVERAPAPLLERVTEGRRKAAQVSLRERALAAAVEQEARWRVDERKLTAGLELLRESPRGYDGLTFQQVKILHGPPLVNALLERSFKLRLHDPKAMKWLAYNALKMAEGLQPEQYAPLLLSDLQARAWAELANAFRINDEFAEAEGALGRSRVLLRRGSGDLWLLARVANLESSLRKDQGRIAEAISLIDGVHRLYLKLGDQHLAGRALISKGVTGEDNCNRLQAVQFLRKGLSMLDPDRDPQLAQVGQLDLIRALVHAGEYHQAGKALLRSGLRQSFAGDSIGVLRVRWTEGRVLEGLGKLSRAEGALLQAWAEFRAMGLEYTAASVGIELLPIWRRQGKYKEMRQAARDVYGTLRSLGIHREAAKALPYLH